MYRLELRVFLGGRLVGRISVFVSGGYIYYSVGRGWRFWFLAAWGSVGLLGSLG